MTHFFLQSLTIPMRFTYFGAERIPGSIFLFDLKTSENPRECFNFRDDVTTLSVFMRLGSRGIVAVADGGAIDMGIGDMVRRDGERTLHPLQFSEIGARIFYKATLFNRTPKYIMHKHNDDFEVMQMRLLGFPLYPFLINGSIRLTRKYCPPSQAIQYRRLHREIVRKSCNGSQMRAANLLIYR